MIYNKRSFDLQARARNLLGRIDSCPDEESIVQTIADELMGVFSLSAMAQSDTKCQFNPTHHCVMDVYDTLNEMNLTDD